ncbi:MAG: cytochrome c oxidase assembly protein [Acidimicrobiales bacterium]
MTSGAAGGRPGTRIGELRRWCAFAALLAALAMVVPPLYELARRYLFVEAIQFAVFAMVIPALFVHAAPIRRSGRSAGGGESRDRRPRWAESLATSRRRHPEPARALAFLLLFMCAAVAWRTPAAVDAIERQPWLLVAEAISLVVVGVAFWSEIAESGPVVPRARRPLRAVMAAVAMWTVWTVSYLAGFSSTSWYPAFHHVSGRGLSAAADQQFATGVLWLVGCVVFMPVVFWNLLAWLRSEDSREIDFYGSVAGQKTAS